METSFSYIVILVTSFVLGYPGMPQRETREEELVYTIFSKSRCKVKTKDLLSLLCAEFKGILGEKRKAKRPIAVRRWPRRRKMTMDPT